MGEIGLNRHEYLYDLTFTDLLLIERGYYRRSRDLWSSQRWSTYNVMAAFCGGKNLRESGIHSPRDLITFPWERSHRLLPTEDDIKELQAEMKAMIHNSKNTQQ